MVARCGDVDLKIRGMNSGRRAGRSASNCWRIGALAAGFELTQQR